MKRDEAAEMVELLRGAWPDDALSDDDAREATKLFAAYDPDIVRQVIDDRLEADLPRPGRVELSRVLRVYQGTPAKDPEPEPPVTAPRRPWIADMEPPPPIPADFKDRVAELRALIPDEPPKVERREPFVVDRENLRVVPPSVYAAAEEGRRQFQESRRARLDAAK